MTEGNFPIKTSRNSSGSTLPSPPFLRRLAVSVFLVNLFVIVLAGGWLDHTRTHDQQEAANNTRNLAQILEQYIVGAVGRVDLALLTVVDEHARLAAAGGIDARVLNELLARQQDHLPEIISLRVADAAGTVRYGPGVAHVSAVNVADRDYFIQARDNPQAKLVLSKPLFARISKKWAIVLARRLNQPDGSFAGVVYVNLALEHLSKTFSTIDVGAHGVIALRDEEFGLIARHPELGKPGSAIGQKAASQKLRDLVQAGNTSGTYIAQAATDSIERTFTFRKISAPPYYIFVGLATEDYLADWRKSAASVLTLVAAFMLTTLISAWLLYRAWQRQMVSVAALEREEIRFRTVADYTYDWEYWQGPKLEILYMTPSCERISGYSPAEFVAAPNLLVRILHPEDRHLMEAHLNDVTTQDEAMVDFRIVRRDGDIRWIAHGCRAVFSADGRFMGRRASNRDITERRLAEESLRESESRLHELFENMSSGVAVYRVSPDGQDFVFTALNRATERIEHLRREDLIGKNLLEIFPGAKEFGILEVFQRVWQSGVAEHFPLSFYQDGRIFGWRENYIYKLPNDEIVAIYDDITERKQAEEAVRLLNETLDQRVKEEVTKNLEQERLLIQQSRLAAMGEMIGNIAHQWRQPLNALGLLLDNLKDANDYHELDTPMIEAQTEKGRQLIDKMSTTIDDFRNFFKPNKVKEDFGLEDAIEKTLNLIGNSLKIHNIAVHVENDHGIRVNGFPNEFSQVLLNIFNNAKDAMLEKKQTGGKIEVSLDHDDKTAWVVIRDNADGIPDDILPRIFDPYFTTKEKGTGIGLYMSKMIMEHMNGTIDVRNTGDGAEFRLALPYAPQSNALDTAVPGNGAAVV